MREHAIKNIPQKNEMAQKEFRRKVIRNIVIYVALALYTIFLFFPFLIVIITSFTTRQELADATGFVWFPKASIEGYRILFTNDPNMVNGIPSLLIGFFNTMWQSILPTVCGLAVSGLAAYAYAKYDFPGKNKFFAGNLLMMTIPLSAGMAGYLFYAGIGWTTGGASVLPLIIPGMFGSAGTIFFIYPYIKALPNGVVEAAKIDGMGFFGIFFRIILPLAKPVFLAQFLFGFVGSYNNYSGALLYLMSEKPLWTLQLALQQITKHIGTRYTNAQCAAALISMIPLLFLYAFVQKFFIEGITAGSVKE